MELPRIAGVAYVAFFLGAGTLCAVAAWYRRPPYEAGIRRAVAFLGLCSATLTIAVYWLYIGKHLATGAAFERHINNVVTGIGVWTSFVALCGFAGRGSERFSFVAALAGFFLWLPAAAATTAV
jgi:hypothetical protein